MAADGSMNEELGVDLRGIQAQIVEQDRKLSSFERRAQAFIAAQKNVERDFNGFEARMTSKLKGMSKQIGKFAALQIATGLASDLELPSGPVQEISSIGTAAAFGFAFGGAPGAAIAAMMASISSIIQSVRQNEQSWADLAKRVTELKKTEADIRNRENAKLYAKLLDEQEERLKLEEKIEEHAKEAAYDTWTMMGAT